MAIKLRKKGFKVEKDYLDRSLKAQLKSADRFQVKFVVIIGEEELSKGQVILRDMKTSAQTEISINNLEAYLEGRIEE